MPQFNPYPIVNPDQYKDRNIGQEFQQGLNQGLETLIQAQQAKKAQEQQDFARAIQLQTLKSQIGSEGLLDLQGMFPPQSRSFNSLMRPKAGPPVAPGQESALSNPTAFADAYGTNRLKMFQEAEDRKRKILEQQTDIDYKKTQIAKNNQDFQANETAKIEAQDAKAKNIEQSIFKAENINKNVDKALEQATYFSSGIGSVPGRKIPGSDYKNLNSTLNTIRANLAFETLQQMREASKTGGALGQVSERELALLESALAALDQDQSVAQLKDNLTEVKVRYNNVINALRKIQTTGDTPIQGQGGQPGYIQTATNPQTGQKIGTRDGVNWEPIGGGQ